MNLGMWGKKVGMTQIFVNDEVVPVTAIDMSNWYITQIKTPDKDGYVAVQIGCVRDRYASETFVSEWLQQGKRVFKMKREVKVNRLPESIQVGDRAQFITGFSEGDIVDVVGVTKGRGFAGTIKRHNFGGSPVSHGSKMGRRPGSLSWMRSHGRVIKGKRLAGHMGTEQRVMKNLRVVKNMHDHNLIFVKGCVPGHAGSFVFVRKAQMGG